MSEPSRHQPENASLDQLRALSALEFAKAAAKEAWKDEYRAYVRALPAVIRSNGLGQAIAMELAGSSKKKNVGAAHKALLSHLSQWLESGWKNSPFPASGSGEPDRLIKAISRGSMANYVRAQAEAMAYLKWLKKFAEALIVVEDSPPSDDADGDS
jgi:CRISPR-associated protein Cmr5